MAKHYTDGAGNYIGSFDKQQPPSGAVEVLKRPQPITARVEKFREAEARLNALNVTRDELLDAILSAMNTVQLGGQVNWPSPLDGILSAWARENESK